MPLALFIVVGLGALAYAISRFSAANFSSAVTETLSVQTLYAAESAAQVAAHQILFDVANKAAADAKCTSVNGTTLNFNAASLNSCVAELSCQTVNNPGGSRIYRIQSSAQCGGGRLLTRRRIEVGAILQ